MSLCQKSLSSFLGKSLIIDTKYKIVQKILVLFVLCFLIQSERQDAWLYVIRLSLIVIAGDAVFAYAGVHPVFHKLIVRLLPALLIGFVDT